MSRKHKRHEEHENHERWLVSYADFITLLFAFFVVMYATSTNNVEKQKKFQESVREELKLTGQGMPSKNTAENLVPELRRPIEGFPKQGGPQEAEDYVARRLNRALDKGEMQS